MKLPSSFNDVTIGQFQECYFLLKEKPTDDIFDTATRWANVISCLTGKPQKEVEALNPAVFKSLVRQISFLKDDSKQTKVKQYILVNKRPYKAIYEANRLSTAQAIDIKTFLKPDEGMDFKDTVVERADKLLASIYLPLTWKGFSYSGLNHAKIAEDFRHAKMGDVWGTLFFYSDVWEKLIKATQDYGKQPLEMLTKHLQDATEWASKNNFTTTGDGKHIYTT